MEIAWFNVLKAGLALGSEQVAEGFFPSGLGNKCLGTDILQMLCVALSNS